LLPTNDEPEIVRESYHFALGDPSDLTDGYHDWLLGNDNGHRVFGYGSDTSGIIPSVQSNYHGYDADWEKGKSREKSREDQKHEAKNDPDLSCPVGIDWQNGIQ